jgi:Polyketide cyclase / dehydrase and lipid transport
MQALDHDEVSLSINASPGSLYALVADVTRTPEFSPEVQRCRWLGGATGPAVGARFEAVNRVGRRPAWRNRPVVTVAEPGREFAFARTEPFAGTVVWRYRFQRRGTATLVTESYDVQRPVSRLGWFIIERIFGGRDRRTVLHTGMEQTLQRLRDVAEADTDADTDADGPAAAPAT